MSNLAVVYFFLPDLLGAKNQTHIFSNISGSHGTIPAKIPDIPPLDGQNRQSLAFSERGQLSQAIPQFHVERMLNK